MRKEPKLIPTQMIGDLRRGGWRLSGRIEGDTDAVKYGDNWRLTAKSGSSFTDTSWREIFSGHILSGPDFYTVERYQSQVLVTAGTMNELLMRESVQDIGFTEQAAPANDHQVTGLQLADIVEHIFKRHCNAFFDATEMPDGVITATDIDTTNSIPLTRYNVQKNNNLWRALQAIGGGEESGEFYRVWFDKRNKFYYQPAPAFWSTPPTSLGTINKNHIKGRIKIKLNNNDPEDTIGQVSLVSQKSFDTFYESSHPTTPTDGKTMFARDGIFADSQAKSDTLATRLYQWLTRSYTLEVEVDPGLVLLGDDGLGVDLSNKITVSYVGATEDAISGAGLHLDISDDYFVYGIKIRFDVAGKMAKAVLILEQDPT